MQLVLGRDLDKGGEHEAVDVRVLAREPQREIAGRRVVVADGRPRLHRVRDQPVVDEIETGHVVGAGEGFVGSRAVADLPVVAEVSRRLGVNLRRAVGEGVAHRHHAGQGGVAHLHQLRRVPGLACALGNHDGHRVSHVAHGIDREHGVGRGLVRLAVLAGDHPAADERAERVTGHIRSGQDRHHAGRGGRGRGVQRERRMRVGRSHERGVGLVRQGRVVGVVAGSGEEPLVLGTEDRCSDAVLGHLSFLPASRLRRPGSTSRCCDSRCSGRGSPPATREPRCRSGPDCGRRGPVRS